MLNHHCLCRLLYIHSVSKAPQQVAAPKKYQSFNKAEKTDKEKKDELISAMVGKMGEHEDDRITGLEDVEGVDSDEWVSSSGYSSLL